jgi:hypothetical protein
MPQGVGMAENDQTALCSSDGHVEATVIGQKANFTTLVGSHG